MPTEYLQFKEVKILPRIPLEGAIDLTYSCNNDCRHCWIRMPPDSAEKELTFEEIKKIVSQAMQLGCRKWSISGGEPMLRADFAEIFEYISANSICYSINTNGTLITPKIARLMKRRGVKMVALYGATAHVHDHVTRSPGSFLATMQGLAYLKEAGAGFIVQIVPMRDNFHQFKEMIKLAESLSKHYRVGAAWLYLSSCGSAKRNAEIIGQRLSPADAVEVDRPDLSYEDWMNKTDDHCSYGDADGSLFGPCIAGRRSFHIDPFGLMSFCQFIKEPSLRYDLKKGNFNDAWDKFIPSLARKVKATQEYHDNCGSCELKNDCRWCPVYGFLEHRRFSAKVDYLCAVAKENKKYKENWLKNHRRYFKIADITIQVDSDLPFKSTTFDHKFKTFEAKAPGEDTVYLRHHFSLPDLEGKNLGREIYHKAPWAVYKNDNSWVYLGILPHGGRIHRYAVFSQDYAWAQIYNATESGFINGNTNSLTLFPTDQLFLAQVLADREGCFLHACGLNFSGQGLLFAGPSEAGKSTVATLFKERAEILCDDRIIVRSTKDGFKIYGTWSHGDVPDVSSNSANLKAILFLEKAKENKLIPICDRQEKIVRILYNLVKPVLTPEWWIKTLALVERIIQEVPCYVFRFDKSPGSIEVLERLLRSQVAGPKPQVLKR